MSGQTTIRTDGFCIIAAGEEIPDNFVVPCYLDNDKRRIAVARVGDRYYAFDDLCSCSDESCPLSGGLLATTTILCQCHGSRFDITTGAVINGPATKGLNVYEVTEVEGGGIQIHI